MEAGVVCFLLFHAKTANAEKRMEHKALNSLRYVLDMPPNFFPNFLMWQHGQQNRSNRKGNAGTTQYIKDTPRKMSCFPNMFADSFVPKTYKTLHMPVELKEKHLQQLLAQVSWPVKVLEVDPPDSAGSWLVARNIVPCSPKERMRIPD
jgi:hypothetical protein